MAAQISHHTLVSFVMNPRRTRAVLRLSLLGEQGADVSRELTYGVGDTFRGLLWDGVGCAVFL